MAQNNAANEIVPYFTRSEFQKLYAVFLELHGEEISEVNLQILVNNRNVALLSVMSGENNQSLYPRTLRSIVRVMRRNLHKYLQ